MDGWTQCELCDAGFLSCPLQSLMDIFRTLAGIISTQHFTALQLRFTRCLKAMLLQTCTGKRFENSATGVRFR